MCYAYEQSEPDSLSCSQLIVLSNVSQLTAARYPRSQKPVILQGQLRK